MLTIHDTKNKIYFFRAKTDLEKRKPSKVKQNVDKWKNPFENNQS